MVRSPQKQKAISAVRRRVKAALGIGGYGATRDNAVERAVSAASARIVGRLPPDDLPAVSACEDVPGLDDAALKAAFTSCYAPLPASVSTKRLRRRAYNRWVVLHRDTVNANIRTVSPHGPPEWNLCGAFGQGIVVQKVYLLATATAADPPALGSS